MTYTNEVQARRTKYQDYEFTVHYLVSLAAEYELIPSRNTFYEMTGRMQSAILKQMLPYAI